MISKHSKNGKYPLVLLHGWGLNSGVWQLVADDLAQHFDVYLIDLPGFGQNNQHAPQPFELDALVELIAPLCPPKSIVLGWSLGGMVAIRLASLYPDKVAQLCLVASSPCFIEQPQWKAVKAEVLAGFSQSLLTNSQKTIERFLAIQAIGSPTSKEDIKWLKHTLLDYPQPSQQALIGGLEILRNCDLRDELSKLSLPIVGIYGRLDSLVPIKSMQGLVDSMDNFELVVMPKASHGPFISHREQFVRQFFAAFSTFL